MKNKLLAFALWLSPFLGFSNACDSLSITVTHPNPNVAITCESFQLEYVVHNLSATAYTNVSVAVDFQEDTTSFTATPAHTTLSGRWLFYVGTVPGNDSAFVTINITYNCTTVHQAVQQPFAANTVSDHLFIHYNGTTCTQLYSCVYDLANPYFNHYAQTPFQVSGNTFRFRDFTLVNNGTADQYFNNYIYFKDSLDNDLSNWMRVDSAVLYKNSTPLLTVVAQNDSLVWFKLDSLPVHFDQDDTIRVREHFHITDCPVPEGFTKLTYRWGCHSTEICGQANLSLKIKRFDAANPKVRIERLIPNPDTTQNVWDHSCIGDYTHWRFKIQNNDSAEYSDVRIILDGHQSGNNRDFPFFTYVLNDAAHPITLTPAAIQDSIVPLDSFPDYLFPNPKPHCLINNPSALYYIDFRIGTLVFQESYILDFYTLRCCPDDEKIDSSTTVEFDLFSDSYHVYFNHWELVVRGNTDCSLLPVPLSTFPNLNDRSLYGTRSISSNNNGPTTADPDLFLGQNYFPPISAMTVPRDSSGNATCGSSQEFTIQNIKFYSYTTSASLDAQLFADSSISAPQGEIKVRIELSPGLYFDTSYAHLPYMHSALLNYTWTPVTNSFYPIVPPAGIGTAYEGIYVFDTLTFSELRDVMSFSDFHYWLYPCCAGGGTAASMKVKFFFNPQPDTACPNCYIPLSLTTDSIDIRCPGCQTPGIETIALSLVREPASYGMFDQDNDGLADATLNQITPTDTAALALIRLNASFSGDHLVSTMRGVFHNGSVTAAHNLTYNNYKNFHPPFKYLYIEQNISRSNAGEFNLIPDSAILTVYSADTFVHHVNLITEFYRSGDMYFFQFLPDSIDTTYAFEVGDEYELKIHFRECGNKIPTSPAAADNAFDADPVAAMYFTELNLDSAVFLTHLSVPTADEGYALLCNAGDSIDTCSLSPLYLDPNWLFFCGAYSCIHRFYSIKVTNVSAWANNLSQDNYSPCHKRMNMRIRADIGGDGENQFPFEYRAPMTSFTVNQFSATIPPGFLSNGATLLSKYHTYLPGCSGYNEINVYENTTYAPITGLQTFAFPYLEQANEGFILPGGLSCGFDSTRTFGSTQYIGDEFAELLYFVNLYPVCDSQECYIPVDTIFANLPIFGCASPDTGYFPSVLNYAYDGITMPYFNPSDASCLDSQLIMLSPPGTITVSAQQIQFQFTIRNTTVDTSTCVGCVFVAPNVWVSIPNTSFLQNMRISCSSLNCYALNNVPPDSNNFFGLGNIRPGNASGYQSCTYTITADYNNCLGDSLHTLPIYYGWYCGPYPATLGTYQYPTSLANDVCSQYAPLTLTFDEQATNFVPYTTSYAQPDSFTLCTSYQFEACVQSQAGGVDSLVAFIQLSDSLLLNDSTIYLFIDGDSILVSADTVSQNLYSVNLSAYDSLLDYNDSLGQAPDELAYGGFICIHYTVTPVCGYNFTSMPEVNFNATTFCGDPIDTLVVVTDWSPNGSDCNPPCSAQFTITTGADSLICDSNCVTLATFISGTHGNLQYLWTPTGDTIANPTVCPDTTTTYIVTAIDSSAGTSAIDSVTVDVITTTLGCCIPDNFQAGVDFNFTGIHSSSLSYNSITTANIILINDTFFVDTNFTFQGCSNVVLGPNAVIWVAPLDTLNIYDSHLYACSDLWNEINVRATATIDVDGSRVENSKQAIFCDGGATIRVVSSVFDQNFYDIYLINPSFPGWNVLIERDTFKCTQTLRNPLPNERTYAHISIKSVPDLISIGNSNYGNYFENADFGIYAEKAQPYIFNNVFFNFQPFNGTTHSYGVVGLNNGNMYVGDYGIANIFEECETGVHIGNSSSFVLDNTYIKNYNSIISVFNSGRTNYIYNNHISSTKNGIISLWNPYSTTEIVGNDIATLPPDSGATNYGIYVGDWSFLGPSGINKVLKNTISSQSTYGIYSNSIKGVEIADNTITLDHLSTPSSTYFGIRSDNCGKGFYNHNCVYRSGANQNLRGITFADSPNSSIYCNITDGTYFGIQLYSNCDQSLTKGNTMVNHHQALVLGSPVPAVGGVMGDQLHFIENPDTFVVGNYYDNNSVGTMTYNLGATLPPFYEFYGTPYFDHPFPNNSFAGFPIQFIQDTSFIPYNLCPDCTNPADGHPDDKKMSLAAAEETAQDTLTDPDEGDIIWKKKKGLYEELKQDSSLIDSSAILETYADTTSTDAIGKLTDAKEAMLAAQDTSIDSTAKVSRIATAFTKNNQVSPQVSPEANEKALNTVYLETYAQGIYQLNSSQLSIVENIASQCPYTGGNAVFTAWNILRTIEPSRTFDDSVLCNGYSLRKAHNQQIKNEIRSASIFRVYPNPTTGIATIESFFNLNADVTINLVSMIGKITKSATVKLKGNSFSIDISGLNSGVYQYQILINGESTQSGKLVLIK